MRCFPLLFYMPLCRIGGPFFFRVSKTGICFCCFFAFAVNPAVYTAKRSETSALCPDTVQYRRSKERRFSGEKDGLPKKEGENGRGHRFPLSGKEKGAES